MSIYLLQGKHLATCSVGIFDHFISSQEHKYKNLKPKQVFHTTPRNAQLLGALQLIKIWPILENN